MTYSYSNAQQNQSERFAPSVQHTLTNIDRYKIDYELVDQSSIVSDNSILSEINLERIELLRHETDDVISLDKNTGLEIIIYSVQKAGIRKSNSPEFNQIK